MSKLCRREKSRIHLCAFAQYIGIELPLIACHASCQCTHTMELVSNANFFCSVSRLAAGIMHFREKNLRIILFIIRFFFLFIYQQTQWLQLNFCLLLIDDKWACMTLWHHHTDTIKFWHLFSVSWTIWNVELLEDVTLWQHPSDLVMRATSYDKNSRIVSNVTAPVAMRKQKWKQWSLNGAGNEFFLK